MSLIHLKNYIGLLYRGLHYEHVQGGIQKTQMDSLYVGIPTLDVESTEHLETTVSSGVS